MGFVSEQGLLAVSSSSECGTIFDTSNSTLPTGTLYCNGETKNTADYPELAAALGESGATFDLPFLVNEKEYDLTVTGTNWTTTKAIGIPYITDDGDWRLKFNIIGALSSKTTSFTGTIDGVVFDSGATTNEYFAITSNLIDNGVASRSALRQHVNDGVGTFYIDCSSNFDRIGLSGDVELDSKPSFVLDNSPTNYDVYKVIRYAPKTALQGVIQAPTMQKLTSGSGTYTTPGGVSYIKVRMVGGGGGGAGSGQAAGTAATAGGDTTFGTSFLSAGGGAQGAWSSGGTIGGAGGTASITGLSTSFGINGSRGGGGQYSTTGYLKGGHGGCSAFGGQGGSHPTSAGNAAATNSGSGGGGAGKSSISASTAGSGGGSGAYIDATISSPEATYSYSIGAAGAAGGAGTSGFAGGAGGSGLIIVEEFYG